MTADNLKPNQRMRPGVKALIVHNKKILMISERVKRAGVSMEIFDFPGGGVDFAETLKLALKREVMEEVGLKIEIEKVVGAWDFVLGKDEHYDPEKAGVHIVCIGYQCSLIGSDQIDTSNNPSKEDIFDAKWYTREELLADNGKMLRKASMADAIRNLEI